MPLKDSARRSAARGDHGALEGEGPEARRVGEVGEGGEEFAERLALGLEGAGEEAVAVEGGAVEGGAAALVGEGQADRDLLEALGHGPLADRQRDLVLDAEVAERALDAARPGDPRHVHDEVDGVDRLLGAGGAVAVGQRPVDDGDAADRQLVEAGDHLGGRLRRASGSVAIRSSMLSAALAGGGPSQLLTPVSSTS